MLAGNTDNNRAKQPSASRRYKRQSKAFRYKRQSKAFTHSYTTCSEMQVSRERDLELEVRAGLELSQGVTEGP